MQDLIKVGENNTTVYTTQNLLELVSKKFQVDISVSFRVQTLTTNITKNVELKLCTNYELSTNINIAYRITKTKKKKRGKFIHLTYYLKKKSKMKKTENTLGEYMKPVKNE